MKTAIMACMRDEAMFVMEWVAYHKAIGFDEVFVCTNGCSDGTDEILDRLQFMGLVHHLRNDDHGEKAPQPAGVDKVLAHDAVKDCRWLLHIDADEFLNIQTGSGLLRDWLPLVDGFDAVAATWRMFGNSTLQNWPAKALQMEKFTTAAATSRPFTAMQKTMFDPNAFGAGIDHMPKQPLRDVTLCNAEGRPLHTGALYHPTQSDHRDAAGGAVNRKRHFQWRGAMINHYAARTPDLFMMKNYRGDAMRSRYSKRYMLNSRWHRAINVNDVEDLSIQRHLAPVKALMRDWRRQDRAIAALEASAFAWLEAKKKSWLTPKRIKALTNVPQTPVPQPASAIREDA